MNMEGRTLPVYDPAPHPLESRVKELKAELAQARKEIESQQETIKRLCEALAHSTCPGGDDDCPNKCGDSSCEDHWWKTARRWAEEILEEI